ncbi:uncharacterized protein [Rutidosis leptorrhynchoides]|uniref:uncharacterized protein n=1 Tax=Rutidosis leptorrhynchoides TaxID=125765 RepID=UPI003A9A2433
MYLCCTPTSQWQVEVTNKEIVAGIMARLGLNQMWAHRTMPKRSTGKTPFSLVYGTEAVIPAEIRVPTQRVLAFDIENAKQCIGKYYNKRVRHVQFKEVDLVLRDNEASRQVKQGKLMPRWEGPYKVLRAHPNGSYTLAVPSDEKIQRTWNAMSLKKFYA